MKRAALFGIALSLCLLPFSLTFLTPPKTFLGTRLFASLESLHSNALRYASPLFVNLTLVATAAHQGAVCLDGSLPGYHLDKGSGSGKDSWIVHLQGGAWCGDHLSCAERSKSYLGSSKYMNKTIVFDGILSNSPSENPDFHNWNRVKVRYCDGGSFSGNVDAPILVHLPGQKEAQLLYYRGQRIWQAIIEDLLCNGLKDAEKAILSGQSAGGLAVFLHCNQFQDLLPNNTDVKCLSDGGLFLDVMDVSKNYSIRSFFKDVVILQNVSTNLPSIRHPEQCFFPQYFLQDIKLPMFILQSAYDTWQWSNALVPETLDPEGKWMLCKMNPTNCSDRQLKVLQDFRTSMLDVLNPINLSNSWGLFIISCFYHSQSQTNNLWGGARSSRVKNKTAAEAVGDWFFKRTQVDEIDCAYPCNPTCTGVVLMVCELPQCLSPLIPK